MDAGKFWWVLLLALLILILGTADSDASAAMGGGNCRGMTQAAGTVVAVERHGLVSDVTVEVDGLRDTVRRMSRWQVGDRVRVTGIVCWGGLSVNFLYR